MIHTHVVYRQCCKNKRGRRLSFHLPFATTRTNRGQGSCLQDTLIEFVQALTRLQPQECPDEVGQESRPASPGRSATTVSHPPPPKQRGAWWDEIRYVMCVCAPRRSRRSLIVLFFCFVPNSLFCTPIVRNSNYRTVEVCIFPRALPGGICLPAGG